MEPQRILSRLGTPFGALTTAPVLLMVAACDDLTLTEALKEVVEVVTSDKCFTEDGAATWTGDCVLGQADGEGTATYDDGIYSSIRGTFIRGSATGEVSVIYRDGSTYEGGWKNGNPHGQGLLMEVWGEGYEGGWSEGREDGEGVFITRDGRRIRGVWGRGGRPSAWYTDPQTGCEIWLSPSGDPIGEAHWSGPCQDGKAHGEGTLVWSDNGDGKFLPEELTFAGRMAEGKMEGQGKVTEVNRYSNLVRTTVYEGNWEASRRSGYGRETETEEFIDDSGFSRIETNYVGDWENGLADGLGERSEIKLMKDGSKTTSTSIGTFKSGRLLGQGRYEEWVEQADEQRHEIREGILDGPHQLRGIGTSIKTYTNSKGRYHSNISGDWISGGEVRGRVEYANGFTFEGIFNQLETPVHGFCVAPRGGFSGECKALAQRTSSFSGRTCLVPKDKKKPCLIEVFNWIS